MTPNIGDRDIGLKIGNHSWGYYQYIACPGCGYTRWVAEKSTRKNDGLCQQCHGKRMRGRPKLTIRGQGNPAWKGGRTLMATGYIRMPIYVDDPFFAMAMGDKKERPRHYWITEHRYVMAKHLSRCLQPWEVVHHKNGVKTDNRIENLELLSGKDARQQHMAFILLQQENETLKQRLAQLEARVTLLEAERVLRGV